MIGWIPMMSMYNVQCRKLGRFLPFLIFFSAAAPSSSLALFQNNRMCVWSGGRRNVVHHYNKLWVRFEDAMERMVTC